MKGLKKMKIVDSDLPNRIKNAVIAMGIYEVETLRKMPDSELDKIPNIGNKMKGFLRGWKNFEHLYDSKKKG
jgi:DNA-directed RNA polymerase alpha subunit